MFECDNQDMHAYIAISLFKERLEKNCEANIGYEPADLTDHAPPTSQNDRGWVHFFRIGV